ncbi:hypothetical protein TBLA_0I02020 [Henningerozyma blattae CBS 6284]|uniref:Thioredoxin domain-containing protein n=1 Tax=Henningerozyma blattae (strain ATCC 34711 / CBS 6284 / DSM 70876 / NBRC 10599 / NRRL Y-10934 / UCD 77-7) TaxID=1071380 RepID=I2H908_HENB6|nr:hypothetical protein TBLA_0I02020 [Tetrapisispora blattae CBS 6284]CCH62860.1 hypothetical protein TBLA_0I02020 [Tetrapisispora blattae CBS 6284]
MLSPCFRGISNVISRRYYWNVLKKTSPLLNESYNRNQTFLPVQNEDELSNTTISSNKVPLILNFTTRNNEKCDKLTGALTRIVLMETEKRINAVDVEVDWFENVNELLYKYSVRQIPTLIAWKDFNRIDEYVPKDNFEWYDLKAWIDKNGID